MRTIRRGVGVTLTLGGPILLGLSLTSSCVASGTCELMRGIQLLLGWILSLLGGVVLLGEFVGRRRG